MNESVGSIETFRGSDFSDLCEATEAAILDGGGFGWVKPPPREVLEAYWRGVLLVPERRLFVARLERTICGSAQLVRQPRNNEAQAFAASLVHAFIAPWARGRGLARALTLAVEEAARATGFKVLWLDVRETQTVAIKLYESLGFVHWGTNPNYACIGRKTIAGRHYYKKLS